ncbi:MAG: FkbM family methyltransferase [Bacteroidia bacterium]
MVKILYRLRLLKYLNLVCQINLNNVKFKIPIIGEVGYSNLHISEPWMIAVLKIITPKKNNLFIDVGTNIGQTLLKLKSVSSDINYIGFEPNPSCVFYMEKLIELNQFKNVDLYPIGISTETAVATLNKYSLSNFDASASIIKEFRPNQKIVKKINIPLFDFKKLNLDKISISILKIDVEGAELEVIHSFKEKIKNDKPIILIEILPTYSQDNFFRIERQNQILDLLNETGYNLYQIVKENESLHGFKNIRKIEIHSDLNMCEYIFIHNEDKIPFENSVKSNSFKIIN